MSKGIDFDRKPVHCAPRVRAGQQRHLCAQPVQPHHRVQGHVPGARPAPFYADLQDPDYESAIGMVHSRFSTNTNPSWMRAHPNRFILHNGEINTIKGNTDAMLAREESISSSHSCRTT